MTRAERRSVLLAVAAVMVVATSALGGSLFTSTQDAFAALFPGPPYVESRTVAVGDRADASLRMYRFDEPRTTWLIGATDIAGLTMDLKRTLVGARDGLVAKSGGTVTSEKPVRIGKYDGLALRLERPDKSVVRARLCVTALRIYEVIVMTTEEAERLSRIEGFLDSFSAE